MRDRFKCFGNVDRDHPVDSMRDKAISIPLWDSRDSGPAGRQ